MLDDPSSFHFHVLFMHFICKTSILEIIYEFKSLFHIVYIFT